MEESKVLHKTLCVPENLAHIFSFLEGGRKSLRLVSRTWNNVILANFQNKFRLKLEQDMDSIGSVLSAVDEKILSSVSVDFMLNYDVSEDHVFQGTLRHSRFLPNLTKLRVLKLACIREEKTIYSFIQLTNDGCFTSLNSLELYFSLKLTPAKNNYLVLATSGALPKLKHFDVRHWDQSNAVVKFWTGCIPAAIQSLVAAAHNLQTLKSNMLHDLAGNRVMKLTLLRSNLFNEEKLRRMLCSTKESLRELYLSSLFPRFHLLPCFPKLEVFNHHIENTHIVISKIKFRASAFPALKGLNLRYSRISWAEFPPARKMEEISLEHVPLPKPEEDMEPFRRLLNANVARLKLQMFPVDIQDFLNLLQLLNLEEREESNPSTMLKLYGLEERGRKGLSQNSQIGYFTSILDKLCTRWDRVEFSRFVFIKSPVWTEIEVPLLNGLKTCKIKNTKLRNGRYHKTHWNVSCKIRSFTQDTNPGKG